MFEPTKSRHPTHNRALLLRTQSEPDSQGWEHLEGLFLFVGLFFFPFHCSSSSSSCSSSSSLCHPSASSPLCSSSLFLSVLFYLFLLVLSIFFVLSFFPSSLWLSSPCCCCPSSCCIWVGEEMALPQQPFSLCVSHRCVMQTILPTFDETLFWLALSIHIFLIFLEHLNFCFDWNDLTIHISEATEILIIVCSWTKKWKWLTNSSMF